MEWLSEFTLCLTIFNFCRQIEFLDIVRVFAVVIWIWVLYQSLPGLQALLFKNKHEVTITHRNDAWVAGVALSIIFFNLRWYVSVDSTSVFTSLYLFSIMIALARILSKRSEVDVVKESG